MPKHRNEKWIHERNLREFPVADVIGKTRAKILCKILGT